METIKNVEIALYQVPLKQALSDAKVLTGRQKPLAHVDMLTATITTSGGAVGFGFSYSLRAGGNALFAHAKDLAAELIGEDPAEFFDLRFTRVGGLEPVGPFAGLARPSFWLFITGVRRRDDLLA